MSNAENHIYHPISFILSIKKIRYNAILENYVIYYNLAIAFKMN